VADQRRLHWAWVILGVCYIIVFINYALRIGYGVILPEMIRTLGFNRASGGSIFNAHFFTYCAVTPLTGYLTDRLGARRVITIGIFFLGVGACLMGTVKTTWTAGLFFAVCGIGSSGIWTPVITLIQRWFAFHRKGLALGILSSSFGLGFATMGATFPWIVANFNWRYAWYFLGIAALMMVAASGALLRSYPEDIGVLPWGSRSKDNSAKLSENASGPGWRTQMATLFKDSRFWLIALSYFAIAYCLYGITTFIIDYANYQLNWTLEKASFLATIHGFCQIIGVLTLLPLSDLIGRKNTIIISNGVLTVCLIAILLAGNSWILLYVITGCMGIFYGATWPMYGACAGDYFPPEQIGTVVGAWTPFYGLGAILTHWISGTLRDVSGVYDQAFAINVIMGALALVLICFVKRKD